LLRPNFGGKVFCAHKVLDVEEKGDAVNEYVYTIYQEYNSRNEVLREGTGTGVPVVLQIEKRDREYQVISHRIPGDSPRYPDDVERMFPKKTHNEIFYGRRDNLLAEVQKEAREFYGIK